MKISAQLTNRQGDHQVLLRTAGREHALTISPRPDGFGSSANGGELLFLALATCYCNDIYREARKRNIAVQSVEVEVSGEFGAEGEPARNISYHASVKANAPQAQILELLKHTDTVAEIQNTLRKGVPVVLTESLAHELS